MDNKLDLLQKLESSPLPDSIKLELSDFILNLLDAPTGNNIQLGNFKIDYFDWEAFKVMFEDIFIGCHYYFNIKKQNPTIIDCGSNIGLSVLFFKMIYPDSVLKCFEAEPITFEMLDKNIKQNDIKNAEYHNTVLADLEGEIELYTDSDRPGSVVSSINSERSSRESIIIKSNKLSKYISSNIDFLKIDIEGAETSVIKDLYETDKIKLVDKIVIEYHHHINKDEDNLSVILKYLEDSGFGYQIQSKMNFPLRGKRFQDILIYAYKK